MYALLSSVLPTKSSLTYAPNIAVLGLPPNLHLMKNSLTADCRPVKPPRPIDGWRDDFHPFVTGKEDLRYSRQMEAAIRRSRSRSRSISPSPLNRRAVPKPREPGDDVVVVPLGTSSAIPSRYRNGACQNTQIFVYVGH